MELKNLNWKFNGMLKYFLIIVGAIISFTILQTKFAFLESLVGKMQDNYLQDHDKIIGLTKTNEYVLEEMKKINIKLDKLIERRK